MYLRSFMRLCLSCIVTLCTNNLSCVSARFDSQKYEKQKKHAKQFQYQNFTQVFINFVRFLAHICAHKQSLKNEFLRIVLYCSAFLVEPKCDLKWMVIWYYKPKSRIPELQIWVTQNNITLRVTNSKSFIKLFFWVTKSTL